MCSLCVLMLFKSLAEIKIKIESHFHCIDIFDDNCTKRLEKNVVSSKLQIQC